MSINGISDKNGHDINMNTLMVVLNRKFEKYFLNNTLFQRQSIVLLEQCEEAVYALLGPAYMAIVGQGKI